MKKTIITSIVVILISLAAIVYASSRTPVPLGAEVTWRDGTGVCISGREELAKTKDGAPLMGYRLRVKDSRAPGGEYVVGIPEKHILHVKR